MIEGVIVEVERTCEPDPPSVREMRNQDKRQCIMQRLTPSFEDGIDKRTLARDLLLDIYALSLSQPRSPEGCRSGVGLVDSRIGLSLE